MSGELAVREEFDPGRSLALAEESFPLERRQQIAQFLSVDAEHPAFLPFLAVAASYRLDPIMGQLYLIPKKTRTNVNGVWTDGPIKYSPMISRDGLLAIARRDPSYMGVKHDVVCANDTFVVEHDTASFDAPPKVTHVYAPKDPDRDVRQSRGAVVGAWAICYLRDRPPVYYFADIREHGKMKEKNGSKVWDGAWESTSAMIVKSAVSYVLRLGLGVTGLVPLDELKGDPADHSPEPLSEGTAGGSVILDWDVIGREIGVVEAARLRELTAEWPPAKLEMKIGMVSGVALLNLLAELEPEELVDADVVPEEPAVIVAARSEVADLEIHLDSLDLEDEEQANEAAMVRDRLAEAQGNLDALLVEAAA